MAPCWCQHGPMLAQKNHLGASWALLGGSWGRLGRVWGASGGVLDRLGQGPADSSGLRAKKLEARGPSMRTRNGHARILGPPKWPISKKPTPQLANHNKQLVTPCAQKRGGGFYQIYRKIKNHQTSPRDSPEDFKKSIIFLDFFIWKYFAYKPISDGLFWWFDPARL